MKILEENLPFCTVLVKSNFSKYSEDLPTKKMSNGYNCLNCHLQDYILPLGFTAQS